MSLRGRSPKQSPFRQWNPLDAIIRLNGDRSPALPGTCARGKCAPGRLAPAGSRPERGASVVATLRLLALTWPLLFFLSSCSPDATQTVPSQVVNVYSTSAAQPWLAELYDCAANSSLAINLTDPASAEIVLRIGEPKNLTIPAYQIDSEEILIVTHRESPVQNLSLDEARALFAGQGNPSVQVWVYDSGEDLQEVFDQHVMAGGSVTSFAKMATSPQQMSDLLNAEKDAVGILPKHWKAGDSRVVFDAGTVPVLATVKTEPKGVVRELLACLQK